HGTLVPRDLIEDGWDARRVFDERNVEVRRCAIERIGWTRFVREARLEQVGETHPDPANPGFELTLFAVPSLLYLSGPARVLLCTNASRERDGSRRSFGLIVPASVPDALAAAAWTFDLDRERYARLEAAS